VKTIFKQNKYIQYQRLILLSIFVFWL